MKRVHDHKGEPESLGGSPAMGSASQSQRRINGRKRKASGPIAGEPMPQRNRSEYTPVQVSQPMPMVPQTTQSIVLPYPGYHPQASNGTFTPPEQFYIPNPQPQRRESHDRQLQLYSQWANQRDIITRQMDSVQSPDDEVNIQRLSQNIEELRRLSQEARRG
ncbi:hypothetical protein B0A55_11111 [Friedmanniomyces simplex]|uniref:Uncharacterized protein n=1 Tax=Friedmanniomyces simplex TaxID=329884 RepID=A0A4U0WJI5_9PEZI|nr:hypothetical protein B0A55_11111 [Friedmanniomyces simplex]